MFRLEPNAELRHTETTRPHPGAPGVSYVQRSYVLDTGAGGELKLAPGFGEAIAAGQASQPQPIGETADRFWWAFEGRVYSTPDRLSRAAVARMARREEVERSSRPRSDRSAGGWPESALGA